ncbi:MAG: hypothetical protein Q9167_005388 [Letrouitia subvulpina]
MSFTTLETSLENIELTRAQWQAEAGEYWLITPQGQEPWPVVICDEGMVKQFFKSKRPQSARKPDGSWHKGFGPNGDQIRNRSFPSMCLGTLKLCWVSAQCLRAIDLGAVLEIQRNTSNSDLVKAYTELIDNFGVKELTYWKDVLLARRMVSEEIKPSSHEELKAVVIVKDSLYPSISKCCRKRPPQYSHQGHTRSRGHSESDDEEPGLSGSDNTRLSTKKIKVENTEAVSLIHKIAPTKQPSAVLGHQERRSSSTLASSLSLSRDLKVIDLEMEPINPDLVSVYVGNPHRIFQIERSAVSSSPFLEKLQAWNSTTGWYIMAPPLSSIHADDFFTVADFLNHGDYHPRLLDVGTSRTRLDGSSAFSPEEKHLETLNCGIVFTIAHQVDLPRLQALAFSKIKFLKPYSPFEFLVFADLAFGKGCAEADDFIVHYLAEHFWDLVDAEKEKFVNLVHGNNDLESRVFLEKRSSLAPEKDQGDGDISASGH